MIPSGWIIKKIGVIANVITGGTPSTFIKEYWNGNIRWMNSGELNLKKVREVENRITKSGLDNSATKLIPKYCVLIGLAGQGKTRGTVAMNMVELCINQSIAAIFPNEFLSNEFLYYYLDSKYKDLRKVSTGVGGRGGLNLSIIKNYNIPFPKNKKEQNEIVTVLSDIDELISGLEKLIEKKKNIKQGAMQELLKSKKGWKNKKLGELLDYEQPTKYIVANTDYNKNNSIPVLTAGKSFILGFTNEENGIFRNFPVIIFDDFLTTSKYVDFPFKVKSSAIKILKPKNSKVNIKFVFEAMQQIIYTMGVGNHKRHWIGEFQKIEIKVPDTEEQNRISNILREMDKEIKHIETKLEKHIMLKQGMMQNLLTGKIRLIDNG